MRTARAEGERVCRAVVLWAALALDVVQAELQIALERQRDAPVRFELEMRRALFVGELVKRGDSGGAGEKQEDPEGPRQEDGGRAEKIQKAATKGPQGPRRGDAHGNNR